MKQPTVSSYSGKLMLPFPIPDTISWDRRLTIPTDERHSIDYKKRGPTTRVDWLWAFIRLQVIVQKCNQVIVNESDLRLLMFGASKYRQWRRELKHVVKCAIPPQCYSWEAYSIRKLKILVPEAWLGRLIYLATPRDGLFHLDNMTVDRRKLRKELEQAEKAGSPQVPFLQGRLDVSGGRLGNLYLPVRLLGHLAGLSAGQVNIVTSLHREITRVKGSRRPDKARIFEINGERLISFNGNRKNDLHPYGYSLAARIKRAGYRLERDREGRRRYDFWSDTRLFLNDLSVVGHELGLRLGLEPGHVLDTPWKEPDGGGETVSSIILADSTRETVATKPIYTYGPEDYLQRWRSWLEERSGAKSSY